MMTLFEALIILANAYTKPHEELGFYVLMAADDFRYSKEKIAEAWKTVLQQLPYQSERKLP